jgi:PAS domain S-box-containing protein
LFKSLFGGFSGKKDSTKQESAMLNQIAQMMPNALVMTHQNGIIEMVNDMTEKYFGYQNKELLGQPIDLLLPEPLKEQHSQYRMGLFANPELFKVENPMDLLAHRKDGIEFPVEINFNQITTSAGVKILTTFVDISSRKYMEKRITQLQDDLKCSNEEMNNFTFVASHDLKAPLSGIQQLASWIYEDLADQTDSDTKYHLELMRKGINRMEMLLNDLVTYTRAGHSNDEIVTVNTYELVNEVLGLTPNPKKIALSISGVLPVLQTRKIPLELVFSHLINNAIKHHDKAQGKIEISARDLPNNKVEFTIKDDGPGIGFQHHQAVFEMLKTLKPRDELEGSGIGLALVKKVVEMQGGTVMLESDGQHGCNFRFTWPVLLN